MQKNQSISQKFTYWLKVVSLGLVLGLGLQFAQAWVAPGGAPPTGNVAGPITTLGNQFKSGNLTTWGLSAPSFVDSGNGYTVDPSGLTTLSSLRVSTLAGANCDLKADASGNFYCGIDATNAGGTGSYAAHVGKNVSCNNGTYILSACAGPGIPVNASASIDASGNLTLNTPYGSTSAEVHTASVQDCDNQRAVYVATVSPYGISVSVSNTRTNGHGAHCFAKW